MLRLSCYWWLVWSTGALGLGATWLTQGAACIEKHAIVNATALSPYQSALQSNEQRHQDAELARLVPDQQPGCDLTNLTMTTKVLLHLPNKYVDQDRIDYSAMLLAGLQAIQEQVPAILIDDSAYPKSIHIDINKKEQNFMIEEGVLATDANMLLFLSKVVFPFVQRNITDEITRCNIEYALVNGMLSTLDPHSSKLNEKETEDLMQSTRGAFGGLGLKIGIKDDSLMVVNPMPDTPAAKAGILPKDKIIQIDEASTVNMSLSKAANLLRGVPKTKVHVTVAREGWSAPKVFVLQREEIFLESVKSNLLPGDIGYVQIQAFQNNDDRKEGVKDPNKKSTSAELDAHIHRLASASKSKQLKGLIIDLRNNPGGLLEQAVAISDRFIQEGDLVVTVGTENRHRTREARPAIKQGNEKEFPMVVLVNGGSASASEIVAGALKNHQRALLLGETTFGKGSVQTVIPFKPSSAMKESKPTCLRLTTAQYLLPGDISIQRTGVTPDIALFPAIVDPNSLHLFVEEKALSSEKDRKTALHANDAYVQTSVPEWKLWYLRDIKPATLQAEEEEDEAAPRMDFEMQLAQAILQKTQSIDRRQMLQEVAGLLAQKKQEEQSKIAKKLADVQVHWQSTTASQDPVAFQGLQSSLQLLERPLSSTPAPPSTAGSSKKPPGTFWPGTAVWMRGEVVNKSPAAAHQIYGIASLPYSVRSPLFSVLEEFAFGTLAAGDKASWQIPLMLPSYLVAGVYGLEMKTTSSLDSNQFHLTPATFRIHEPPAARFAYRLMLDDSHLGNGDGLLQVGEKAQLHIELRNVGAGISGKTKIYLLNQTSPELFLHQGVATVDKVAPGESKLVTMALSYKKKAPTLAVDVRIVTCFEEYNGCYWDNMSVNDDFYRYTEEFVLPTDVATPFLKQAAMYRNDSDAKVPVYTGASTDSTIVAYLPPKGQLASDGQFTDKPFARIALKDKGYGFVPIKRLQALPQGSTPSRIEKVLLPAFDFAPPAILIDPIQDRTQEERIRLPVRLSHEKALMDVYVRVNGKKIHYTALGEQHMQQVEQGVLAKVQVNIPLEVGNNFVAITARSTERLKNNKYMMIYRDAPPSTATAQGPGTKATTSPSTKP